jgi:hypothetical protein
MDTECSICLSALDKTDKSIITVNCCNHQFHINCYLQWMSQKRICPLCRTNYSTFNNVPDTVINVPVTDNEIQRISKIRIIIMCIFVSGFTGFYYYLKNNY